MAERRFVGTFRHGITDVEISQEYCALAQGDEEVARLLYKHAKYRQAAYLAVQAMEKYVRQKIYSLVSARHDSYRKMTTTHNLDDLLGFLIDISVGSDNKRAHVKRILNDQVLERNRFGKLHNDLRYPDFRERYGTHSVLLVGQRDAEYVMGLLDRVKRFIEDIHLLSSGC